MDTETPNKPNSNSTPSKKNKKTPKWLRALEAQSWQAELLISGVIIAGLLQLPDTFLKFGEPYILESSELGFGFLSLATTYVYAALSALVLFFGYHFILRTIWIALLGLNSVFPKGINIESKAGAGPKYWEKAKEEYPNLSTYNQQLDQQCSTIFSSVTLITIMSLSLAAVILIAYQIFRLSISVFPFLEDYVVQIGGGLYLLFMVFTFGLQHLAKKQPDNKRIASVYEKYGKIAGSIFSLHFFRKPVNYITGILISNSTSKYALVLPGIISGFMGFYAARTINENPIYDNFGAERYCTFNGKTDRTFYFNYEDQCKDNQRIFTPIIPSDVIEGSVLKVFIPTIEREKAKMDLGKLSFIKKVKGGQPLRDSIRQANLQIYQDFNQIFINDEVYTTSDIQYYTHPNAGEKGVLIYLNTHDFKAGKNILEIRKDYFSKKEKQKIVRIPFYFEGNYLK